MTSAKDTPTVPPLNDAWQESQTTVAPKKPDITLQHYLNAKPALDALMMEDIKRVIDQTTAPLEPVTYKKQDPFKQQEIIPNSL